MDRLNCALVCRLWDEAISASQVLKDVQLVLQGTHLHEALKLLQKTRRQYRSMKINKGNGIFGQVYLKFDIVDMRDLSIKHKI